MHAILLPSSATTVPASSHANPFSIPPAISAATDPRKINTQRLALRQLFRPALNHLMALLFLARQTRFRQAISGAALRQVS